MTGALTFQARKSGNIGGKVIGVGLMNEKVRVYWNSTRKMWSIKKGNNPVEHATVLVLRDCKFLVNEAGRQRVIRNKKKDVHAYVEGEIISKEGLSHLPSYDEIRYNPFKNETFVDSSGNRVDEHSLVFMTIRYNVTNRKKSACVLRVNNVVQNS